MNRVFGLSGHLLPVHPQPLSNEILSFWLIRLAHSNGLKLHTFYSIVCGSNKQIWNRDIDKLAPEWLMDKLSICTGVSLSEVRNTTLASYEGILYNGHQPNGNTRWITPIGIYHRLHKNHGMQFCSICLATDEIPYFRKQWRLALYTQCEKHHILLSDRCHNCGLPINFHRVELGQKNLIKPRSVLHCYNCGFDYRSTPIIRIESEDWKLTVAYRHILAFHDIGWMNLENNLFQYSHLLFDVLRGLCNVLTSSRKGHEYLNAVIGEIFDSKIEIAISHKQSFEFFPLMKRHIVFNVAIWLLMEWPNRFIDLSKNLHISSSYILREFGDIPYWFESAVKENLYLKIYSPNDEEIKNARRYYESFFGEISKIKLTALLGCRSLKKMSKLNR